MSLSAETTSSDLTETLRLLSDHASKADPGDLAALPDTALQDLVRLMLAVHFAKMEAGQPAPLMPRPDAISPTAVMSAASALLKSANLEIFELGMWEAWSGGRH